MEGSFPLKFVKGFPAVVAGKTLIIADLHVGIEREFWRAGVRASGLSRRVGERVEEILGRTRPKRIVIVGDFKHNIPDFTQREAEEVRRIAEMIASQGELLIVKGNHDGDIEKILPWAPVYPGSGMEIEGIYVLHGHARPAEDALGAKLLVMGHLHPAVTLRHRFGRVQKKAFVVGEWKGIPIIVLPALSPLFVGMDVTVPENRIGPIGKDLDIKQILLLDGTPLG